ncbi:MAG: DEAD/DEAH box helicase [Candidatus Latescibacteria bacterium]|nr:DEAD/DEAH box helicase [Candidatus Latescibacterota bacterium]
MRIQSKAIPIALDGRDLIGCAQTGTGKTAAFALPILQRLVQGRRPQALILTPTRELAIQVGENIRAYGKYLPFRYATVYGGVSLGPQITALRKGVDVIIATPGRLRDHLRRGTVSLKTVRYLVLDEADRMLDMGFLPDVEHIINQASAREQTMLFSATMPPEIRSLAARYMKDTVRVEAAPPSTVAEGITHRVYPVPRSLKNRLLLRLIVDEPVQSALIFTRTRRGADRLADYLERQNLSVARLHSDRTQGERQRALTGFRSGQYKILVATDIAARGLDIPSVSHVFNYDLPERVEDYIHRAGRTARAEGTGYAFCLMTPEEIDLFNPIEAQVGRQGMAWISHPGFDYLSEPPAADSGGDRKLRGMQSRHRGGSRPFTRPARPMQRRVSGLVRDNSAATPPTTTATASIGNRFGRKRTREGRRLNT